MIVYHPEIKVTLIKSSARKGVAFDDGGKETKATASRYGKSAGRFDLTPYLGDGAGVRTTKNVREPAGGFSLTLLDMPNTNWEDSIYGLIEPMDMVEIRFRHGFDATLGKKIPIVMRGFVSEVRREETMGQDGKPSRKVIVTGQDAGKILQIFLIYYLNNLATSESTLATGFQFMQKFGTEFGEQLNVGDFFANIVDRVLNPFMKTIVGAAEDEALKNGFIPIVSIKGAVSPFVLSSFQDVSLYQMLKSLLDVGAFNEMYVEDAETSVNLVLRPIPFADVNGNLIQAGATVLYHDLLESDIQSLSVSRSDHNVGNWFWVQNNHWMLINDISNQLTAQNTVAESVDKRKYPNCAADKFGFRNMHETVSMGPEVLTDDVGAGTQAIRAKDDANTSDWLKARRVALGDMNKDNAVFESGTMRVRGDEKIKAGMILKVKRGDGRIDQYYAVGVDHDYVPFQGCFTSVQFERGTGFISRAQPDISPYRKEWDRGGLK
ncbi:MAG TPA: hypothetical protein PKZ37_14715 [Gallionellaceae bacterium]|jgi:hypothetical protein|nr:hypothetical protein [Gallionellaceae bacterium]